MAFMIWRAKMLIGIKSTLVLLICIFIRTVRQKYYEFDCGSGKKKAKWRVTRNAVIECLANRMIRHMKSSAVSNHRSADGYQKMRSK